MNWLAPRFPLTPSKTDFSHLHPNTKLTIQERNQLLKKNNFTCRTCAGTYRSYLIATFIQEENCFDLLCPACRVITHLNTGLSKGIDLYYTEMDQLDIVRKTIDYIISTKTMPTVQTIDPQAKQVPISLLEFINLLAHNRLPNYKIFFNGKFDFKFVLHNYCSNNMTFVEDNSYEKSEDVTKSEHYDMYNEDNDTFNKIFIK